MILSVQKTKLKAMYKVCDMLTELLISLNRRAQRQKNLVEKMERNKRKTYEILTVVMPLTKGR